MIIHFGVIDLPYTFRAPVTARRKKPPGSQSTGDVAGYLENRYHVMEHFFQTHKEDVASDLEESLAGALENVLVGGPPNANPLADAMSSIEGRFKQFLSSREIESLGYPGIPTRAALKGVNHRFKKNRGGRRPSFIDTGLYQSSFKAWSE